MILSKINGGKLMDYNSKKTFWINICCLIIMICFSAFIITNMICSLFQTAYMELYLDTEKPLYRGDSPFWLAAITIVFLYGCKFGIEKKKITDELCIYMERIALIWTTAICFIFIVLFRVHVACDSAAVSDAAIEFLNKDFSAFSGDGYLVYYPHQLGFISFLMIIYYLFGENNFLVIQCINVIFILCMVYYFHRISEELFHDLKSRLFTSILCMCMFPVFLMSTFIYGDIPGLGLAVMAVYYIIRFLNSGNRKAILPATLSLSIAILFKNNNLIILVAVVMLLLLKFIKTKDRYALLFILVIFLSIKVLNATIDVYFITISGLDRLPEGIPKIAWIAMGLQRNEYLENGWYNSYNWNVYGSNLYDPVKTTAECLSSVKESVQNFVRVPLSAVEFFARKFVSQWNDPTFHSQLIVEWYSRHRNDHSNLAKFMIYGNGRTILGEFMNWYHSLVLLGSSVFAVLNVKKGNLAVILIPLCVLGGYLFHLIWEAKGRYGLGYFILCIPIAAWGLGKISELKWRFK